MRKLWFWTDFSLLLRHIFICIITLGISSVASRNNPVKYTDPDGNCFHILVGAGIGDKVSQIGNKIKPTKVVSKEPYANLSDSSSVGPGKPFTSTQKKLIFEEDMKRNGGVVRSDGDGRILKPSTKSMKGISPSPDEWQIDHIYPRSLGGSNSYTNAQVLSRQENILKSNLVE